MSITSFFVPAVICAILIYGLYKGVDVFDEFLAGARENLRVGVDILPALIALVTCVAMFNASGGLDLVSSLVAHLTNKIGFPSECIPLALIRPISGSGAIAVFESILTDNSPDSYVGRVASVLLGSTETTFYTIAVYYGAAKIKKTGHTVTCALSADIAGFILSALVVRLLFY
ncbi:MAG: spore maturation protein [Oscillospiraceae bacterium]